MSDLKAERDRARIQAAHHHRRERVLHRLLEDLLATAKHGKHPCACVTCKTLRDLAKEIEHG